MARTVQKGSSSKKEAQTKSSSKKDSASKKPKSFSSYATYIKKVAKQVHPDAGLTSSTVQFLGAVARHLVKDLVSLTNTARLNAKHITLTTRDVQTATRLYFPGELAKHAVSEGTKAVSKYGTSAGGSAAARAGLQFSPARIRTEMKTYSASKGCACRISAGAPVYMAAVVEYIMAELLELGGTAARANKAVQITTRHIRLAVLNDEELNKLFKNVVFPNTTVLPAIHKSLIPQHLQKKQKK